MEDPGSAINSIPLIFFIIAAFLLGSFLSLLKNSLVQSRRARLRFLAEGGNRKYLAALELLEKIDFYKAGLFSGIIFFEILSGCLGGITLSRIYFFERAPGTLAAFSAIILLSLLGGAIFFILAEAITREIARLASEKILALFVPVIKLFSFLASPMIAINTGLETLANSLFRSRLSNPGMTEDELKIALLEGEKSGIVESKERTMVEGVFYLGDKPVGAFMTHRSEVAWLDINTDPEKARKIAEEAGDQRFFPVVSGNLDEVSGVVSVEAILLALLKGPWPGLNKLMQAPCFIPEKMPALKAFETFKKAETACLFVMDEYGGFAGILTIRNLIEEIVGELSNSEGEEDAIIRREDGTWLADGSVSIDDAAQALSLSSLAANENPEYHTLAGFILDLAGEIPGANTHFDFHGFRFTVAEMDGNRINRILITKLEEPGIP